MLPSLTFQIKKQTPFGIDLKSQYLENSNLAYEQLLIPQGPTSPTRIFLQDEIHVKFPSLTENCSSSIPYFLDNSALSQN